MNQEENIGIIVISKENSIEKIKVTINNLKDNLLEKFEYIIAINCTKADKLIEYCKEQGIKYFVYKEKREIYFKIPEMINGKYVAFIKEGDTYSKGVKNKLFKHFEKQSSENIFICPILYNNDGRYILNRNLYRDDKINIERNPEKIWINICSCFIKKDILKEIEKTTIVSNYNFEENILIKLICLNGGYAIIRNVKLTSAEMLEDDVSAKIEHYDKDWYYSFIDNAKDLISFSKNKFNVNINFIQHSVAYMLKIPINSNVNVKNKHILINEELDQFYLKYAEVLKEIKNSVIFAIVGNKLVNYYLMRLKNNSLNKKTEYREFLNELCVVHNNEILFSASNIKIKILLMDYVNGNLEITGTYPLPFEEDELKIYAKYNNECYYAEKNNLYSAYKAFGEEVYTNYAFTLKIPLKKSKNKKYIEFYLEGKRSNVKLDIAFCKPLSRLSKSRCAYWNCGGYTLNYRRKSILVMKNSKTRHIKREVKLLASLLSSKNKSARQSGRLRVLYNLTKPFYKKEIWLFADKIYKGGDNGEYLYTYSMKQKDGIKKYYTLKKGCLDEKRFKKEKKKYIYYNTLKHKLLFLNSNVVFETHNNVSKFNSFDEEHEKYFRDLFNSYNVCIQHGLTVQNIPHLTNRINDNLKQYFLASPVEKENMLNLEYAYKGHEDILKITGSPRYDGLINNDKKQILITPTWRNYLALPSLRMAESRQYNNNFKESSYYKIYNELINNKKLIDVAKKTGYKIIYLLHPCTSSQINDYDKNEFVKLIAATDNLNYEKILTESSLMVTDYSGVQFDFAYMYKPIIYFHPNELPPSYEEGEYKYSTMALGDITKTVDETVDLLCEYMNNKCQIKKEYKSRIDKFFKYHDNQNSKRIYDEIIKVRNLGKKQK